MVTVPLVLLACASAANDPPTVVVDRDNVEITRSCVVRIEKSPIADADGNGVIQITGPGITVDLGDQVLRGSNGAPDTFTGTGISITGKDVTLRGGRIHGYKVGVHARFADDLVVEDGDVSGNYRQRLGSTWRREDAADWLRPHANDDNEWLTNYGAGVYVEDSARITIRRVRARQTQNGIVLDRVGGGEVYDNDCAFGSGWGIALWRSSRNTISRNACDFRIRGYSHGVYNRGQDSAGILLFEQCERNTITHNSMTHCGDGLFLYAGDEALGKVNPNANPSWYVRRGSNRNVIAHNDCSYAAAHGIEVLFSFSNRVLANRITGNAICGIWGGYSQACVFAQNEIDANGEMPYGSERGGINIEHGRSNYIAANTFRDNPVGIFLWWDRDREIGKLPWAQANPTAVEDNALLQNTFQGDLIALQLRGCGPTTVGINHATDVEVELDADEISRSVLTELGNFDLPATEFETPEPIGKTSPVGALDHLRGREHIVMTEWGPYDWRAPRLFLVDRAPGRHVYRLLGPEALIDASVEGDNVALTRDADGHSLIVAAAATGAALPYTLTARTASGRQTAAGVLVQATWAVTVFRSEADPREDLEAWRRGAEAHGVRSSLPALDLRYGPEGPAGLQPAAPDHFGTIATTTIVVPAGTWRIRTTSDDGIRVRLDGAVVIDDWTLHATRTHEYEFTVAEPEQLDIRVEHFELEGNAELSLDLFQVE
jgi:parallel beta-helix repeat protein